MPSEDFEVVDASPNSSIATTFVSTSEELKKTDNDRIYKALAVANTTWKVNPHMSLILAVSGRVWSRAPKERSFSF